ncbi:IS2 repressor TnpA [Marinibacterium anthonyi]|uniref:IS66-like element accessory protein TnpA n=1 Tax=Poseidonocella sp. HB161398 TaxID=2320855 RepID=UPI000D9BED17|nr:transposase [Poseidonocella sp. HB161398]QEW20352.1 IS2 repressor TnpA [Marinibacterium anthonyi]
MSAHFEVLTNERETQRRNRKWPDELKAEIVAETLRPGATVNAVAARHGLQANQVSAWRRMARDGRLVLPAPEDAVEFVSLMVAPAESPTDTGPSASGSVEIAVGAVTVRLEPGASAERIASVVRALA